MKTEADTVGTTMKKNGKLFDMLRKAFHHEKISVSRKTNSEYVEVMNHNSAIALSEHLNKSLISFHRLKMVCLVGSFFYVLNRCGMVRSFAKRQSSKLN
jgi:hypothetical protein